jgi:two-component system OmpR family sensor kinase/two-component system sensor histidine kinase BaeS
MGMGMRSFLLVDSATGVPLTAGDAALDPAALELGVPVQVDGATVALLAPARLPAGLSANEQALLTRINTAILVSALAAGLVALVAGGVLVASILRPLRRLEEAVAQVAEGNLDVTVETTGRGEIGQLAANFNRMAGNLRRQEELRQRLVADIAHELRTPLSVVQGNLQAILDGVYPLETREIRVIYDETRLLARLVNDLHELAQAEAHRLPLVLQPIAAATVLAGTAESFRTLAEEKGVALTAAAPAPGLEVEADPDRLLQIMHNLVGNALRHTPPGGAVALSAAAEGAGSLVRFAVRDSGPGIAPADLPRVFDRFYRAEASRSRVADEDAGHTAGTGLGLAIVKALAEAHGGAVGVESNANGAGSGSTFWFTLPRA